MAPPKTNQGDLWYYQGDWKKAIAFWRQNNQLNGMHQKVFYGFLRLGNLSQLFEYLQDTLKDGMRPADSISEMLHTLVKLVTCPDPGKDIIRSVFKYLKIHKSAVVDFFMICPKE